MFQEDIQTPGSGLKNKAQPSVFNRLRGVSIPDETLFRVFDMASQTIHNSIILGEILSKSSQNLVLINIR